MTSPAQAIRIEGGIVPPTLLARLQAGQAEDRASLTPSSYHLVGTETVRDAASRAWVYLRGAWQAWRDTEASGQGAGRTRDRWLLPLLRELGYGQLPALPGGLTVDGDSYPISHSWSHVPIHLLGPGVDLDRRNPGVAGAARPPHAMVQELLNRTEEHLWAVLSNGRRLRLLRDSTALVGSAYLEFDLEAIFDGELYADFLLMFQLCHVSRLEKRAGAEAPPADCWLEAWRRESVQAGARALDRLRDGVEQSLTALGSGFLRHPRNGWLVAALRAGELSDRDLHRALLRLVYRLLFCFVAEDRDSLLDPTAGPARRTRYREYFSTGRGRRLSRIRSGGPHPDLWQAQRLVLRALGDRGLPALAVPALGGLFDPVAGERVVPGAPHRDLLLGAELANADFLAAIRALSWLHVPGQRPQPVDYRNLGAEELGGVYESLLELVPRVDLAQAQFRLDRLAGNERKTTGSYYTPPGLVSALLDSALEPLLDDAVKNASSPADVEQRLLALTVCDPACGSGGFLVAAARRIAHRLAQARSGEDEPSPADTRHALREVVGRCIYGVDVNDLAAELAKVSLWLEALEPGKPLGFLDARIRVGNSLLGATPALLDAGVPDAAFKELAGDDKKWAAAIRKRNKAERTGQEALVFGADDAGSATLLARRSALLRPADDVETGRQQARTWEDYERSAELRRLRLAGDGWCAAFVWPLTAAAPEPPTHSVLRQLADQPDNPALASTVAQIERLAADYRFFHWQVEFPEVFQAVDRADGPDGWPGGFSCVLGNPPWERVKLQEQEFFAARDPAIATAPNAAARRRLISALVTEDPALHQAFVAEKRRAEGQSALLRTSGRYPLNGRGDVNTYAVFAELFRGLIAPHGRSGVIAPTGIATDATTQYFFKDLVQSHSLAALYDFENAAPLFPGVHRSFKFCLLTVAGRAEHEDAATFAFFLHDPSMISASEFALTPDEITLLNPNTGTCPIFRTRRDAEITLGIYRRVPVLVREGDPDGNPWGISFMTMFHMSNDSHLFHTREQLEADGYTLDGNVFVKPTSDAGGVTRMLPLYEGRMGHQFNHRFASLGGSLGVVGPASWRDPNFVVLPDYWVAETETQHRLARRVWNCESGMLGHRRVARNNDERSCIATILPWGAASYGWILSAGPDANGLATLLAFSNSLAYDYVLRNTFSQASVPQSTSEQVAMPTPRDVHANARWDARDSVLGWITKRVAELVYCASDLAAFAQDLAYPGPPFRWDDERRLALRTELDAVSFHLYGLERGDVDYILDTFPIVRRKDEQVFGEYRTKRLILEVYDAMAEAIATGEPYQTILDPPPGQGPRHPAATAS